METTISYRLEDSSMYALTVNYPVSDNSTFDMGYYQQSHIPLCGKLLADYGYQGYILHTGPGAAPGSQDLSYARIELIFDSAQSLQAGLDANGAEITADIANYTNVKPQMSFSDVSVELS